MPMFELKISTENAAFHDLAGGMPDEFAKRSEVRRILHRLIEDVASGKDRGRCIDYNGNVVGEWGFSE